MHQTQTIQAPEEMQAFSEEILFQIEKLVLRADLLNATLMWNRLFLEGLSGSLKHSTTSQIESLPIEATG